MTDIISLKLRNREVNAAARVLLRKLDAEATARQRFRHHAVKGFLATSEMRRALEMLSPTDRNQFLPELKRVEQYLLKLSRGQR